MRKALALLLLATTVTAAPWTAEKLQLLPGLYPDQRRALARQVAPLLQKGEDIKPALLEAGVDPDVVRLLDEIYPGPLLVERYAHKLVWEAPGLTEAQTTLFKHLIPSVIAAQWALTIQKNRVVKEVGSAVDDPTRQRLAGSFDRQIREIEKRFWMVMNYALTWEQRAALHRLYPQPYQRPPNLQGHVYQLPGLTPSQANRIRALLEEYGSETAADSAEIRRLQARLKDAPAAERPALQGGIEAATDRVAAVLRRIVKESKNILTAEQFRRLDALTPLLTPADRARPPNDILKQMGVTPEQQQHLKPLAEKVQRRVAEARRHAQAGLGGMEGEMGTDSPQSMTMQVMRQRVTTEAMLAMEEAGHTALTEILDKKQVLGWIISPR